MKLIHLEFSLFKIKNYFNFNILMNNTSGNIVFGISTFTSNNSISSIDNLFNVFLNTFINEVNRIPLTQNVMLTEQNIIHTNLINNMTDLRRTIESRLNNNTQQNNFFSNNLLSNFESIILEFLFNENDEQEDVKVTVPENIFNTFKTTLLTNKNINNYKDKSCNICIEEFNLNEILTTLKCNHFFHKNCIKEWLTKQSKKCPICRNETI